MRLNSDALSDLVILKRGGVSPLAIAPTVPLATFEVNSTGDEHDVNQGDGKCETAPGNKTCTLRAAIEEVDAKAGSYAINFSVSSITVGSQLRSIFLSPGTLSVTIDGGSSKVEIKGSPIVSDVGNCVFRNLVINSNGTLPDALEISEVGAIGNSFIEGNYVGTNTAGSATVGTVFRAISIRDTDPRRLVLKYDWRHDALRSQYCRDNSQRHRNTLFPKLAWQ